MQKLNNDTIIAIILLLMCGLFFWQTTLIPKFGYSSMGSDKWPYLIISLLTVTSLAYLVQSLRLPPPDDGARMGIKKLVFHYRNPLWCFLIFFLFLFTLPFFGMLIGGGLFVFSLLSALGPRNRRAVMIHLAITLFSVGLVWLIFTYFLRVFLPPGVIINVY